MRRAGTRSSGRSAGASMNFRDELPFALLLLLLIATFAFGGGSRFDIESVGPLRSLAALILAAAIFLQSQRSWNRARIPFLLLTGLALWMVVQLIPLPQDLWSKLHGRQDFVRLQELAGMGEVWRPISISPLMTANSLASLVIPAAGLLLMALVDEKRLRRVPWIIIAAGVISALLGIAQVSFPAATNLYFYAITNDDSAVGLFSNRNHNAIFLTIALIFALMMADKISLRRLTLSGLLLIFGAFVIVGGLLVNASRSGLAGLGLAGGVMLLLWFKRGEAGGTGARAARLWGLLAVAVLALAAAGLAYAGVFDRLPAWQRLMERSPVEDQRVETFPYVVQMVRDHMPFGTGFGAFEQAYRMIEPASLLSSRYFNNAHDDWLQLLIEGGVPGALFLLACLVLLARTTFRLVRLSERSNHTYMLAWMGVSALMIFALASIVDYPLRTPSLMLLAAIAVAMSLRPFPPRYSRLING